MSITKELIEPYLRKMLSSEKVDFVGVVEIAGGYLSRAFVVEVMVDGREEKFFVKMPKGENMSQFDVPDIVASYMTSQQVAGLVADSPQSLGCVFGAGDHAVIFDGKQDVSIMQIQQYRSGESFLDLMIARKNSQRVFGVGDKREIDAIVDKIVAVHKTELPKVSDDEKRKLYSKSLRNSLTHPELTLAIFDENLSDSQIFCGYFRYDYLREMMVAIEHFGGGYDRLSVVHGDFWGANVLFDKSGKTDKVNSAFLIDYSRLCLGEPGTDVGHFYGWLLWLSVAYRQVYYKDVAEYFLARYIAQTGDSDVVRYMVAEFGFMGAISAIEGFFPEATHHDREKFAQYMYECMRQKKLIDFDKFSDEFSSKFLGKN